MLFRSTDALGFAHAMDVAMDMVVHRFNDRIREDLVRLGLDKRNPVQMNGQDRKVISSTAVLAGESGEAAVSGGAARRGSSDGTHLATA